MTLLDLQRDFRKWLTAERVPQGEAFGERSLPGLSVYLNNYRGALMGCLGESFAVTRAWLGESAFHAAAATHVDRQPPHSWTLDDYALDFPETLGLLYPNDAEVAELAVLERELGIAFVGRDTPAMEPALLAGIDWEEAVLHLSPTLKLLPTHANAGAIWSAIMREEEPPAAMRLPAVATMALWREGFTAAFRTLGGDEALALKLIGEGATFGSLCGELVERLGEERGTAVAGEMLARWLADGIVVRIGHSE